MQQAAIILATAYFIGVIWLALQVRAAPYGHQIPGVGFIYDIEDTPAHCVECNEWVTSRCGREGCPFAGQPVDDAGAQNTDALSFAPARSFHDSGVTDA